MKKNNAKKKGFTIVELVIVIAVIGILAAILIPTFINLNNKARVSNTTSFLKNVNTQLAMKEANHDLDNFKADYDKDGHFANRTSAENYSKEYLGYNFELISPFDGNYIDFQGGRFALVNYDDEANPEVLYAEADFDLNKVTRMPDTNAKVGELLEAGKNVYLKESIDVTELPSDVYNAETETLTIKGGLEVGNNTSVKNIKYANDGDAQEVVIRTNSVTTDLTIDAAKDTVRHFDFVGKVHVVSVDPVNCYEENGKAAFTQIDSGKYKTTETADVELLFVSDSSAVSLQLAAGTVDHAHAISEAAASAINATNPGITFDYDGNSDQDSLDVYHHVDAQDQLGFTTEFSSNASSDVVAEAIDKKAGEEVAEDPKISTYAARIGTTLYSTFDAAYTSAVSGNKIVLLNNVLLGDIIEGNYMQEDYTSGFNFTKAGITLDLNGKSLVSNVNVGFAFDVISGDLTIKDSVGTGMIRATRAPVVVHCGSSATVNMYGGTILAEYADPNVYNTAALDVDGTANIYGGTLSSQTDWEFEYEGNTYYVFSFSLNNRNITHIYGGTFISKHKDEGGNGIANCRDLYIHDDITTQGLYWTNDNDKKTTKIEVADGKTLTIDGAYDCKRVAGGKDLALTGTGNLIYDSDLFIKEEVE